MKLTSVIDVSVGQRVTVYIPADENEVYAASALDGLVGTETTFGGQRALIIEVAVDDGGRGFSLDLELLA